MSDSNTNQHVESVGDLISRQAAIDAICTEGTRLERNGTVAMAEIKQWCVDILEALPSAQPNWGKPAGNGRPLADSEIIPRLQDIKIQVGDSYAIDRAIEVLEWLSSAQHEKPEQPESAKEYCAECNHIEMCRWYPYEGCEFRSLPTAQPIIKCIANITMTDEQIQEIYEKAKADILAARPERNNGQWIDLKCSICGQVDMSKPNFCPNCGADMRGEQDG